MNEKIVCPVCKGVCVEIRRYFDDKINEYIDEKIICQCCLGQGFLEDNLCEDSHLDFVDIKPN